jgi:hypothetical protein
LRHAHNQIKSAKHDFGGCAAALRDMPFATVQIELMLKHHKQF